MAIVTDLEYSLDNKLVKKLDVMIKRVTQPKPKKDAWMMNEGGEGEGKTNASICEGYYVKFKTGMEIHLFFRLEALIEFAKKTTNKIIIWDEPSLDSLSTDALNELNRNLLRLAMTVRKKRHFFINNFTKFHKFSEYVVVERSLGMVHMYSRREIEPGRFVYIRKRNLEQLWNDYRTKRKRTYKDNASFHGSFPEIMEKHFNKMDITVNGIPHATLEIYEREKDKAIDSIGSKKETKKQTLDRLELRKLRLKIGKLKFPITSKEEFARLIGVDSKRLREWSYLDEESIDKDIDSLGNAEN